MERHVLRSGPGGALAGRGPPGPGCGSRRRRGDQLRTGSRPGVNLPGRPPTWAPWWSRSSIFYGAKEVDYIIGATSPDVRGDGRAVRAQRPLGHLLGIAGEAAGAAVVGGRRDRPTRPAGGGRPPSGRCSTAIRSSLRSGSIPTPPAIVGFTSGTTRDPKGVIHSHRTIGCETRQLDHLFPQRRATPDHRVAGGSLHRHAQRVLGAVAARAPRHLIDVWDPGEVLRLMDEEGLGVTGGATYFLTSLLDHPSFTPEHVAMMPFAGLWRLDRPRGRH